MPIRFRKHLLVCVCVCDWVRNSNHNAFLPILKYIYIVWSACINQFYISAKHFPILLSRCLHARTLTHKYTHIHTYVRSFVRKHIVSANLCFCPVFFCFNAHEQDSWLYPASFFTLLGFVSHRQMLCRTSRGVSACLFHIPVC